MALAQYDVVSPHLVDATTKAQPQPPTFGIVGDYDQGSTEVLWEDGSLVAGIGEDVLDKILAPTANVLTGQRVFVNVSPGAGFQQSSDYQGLVLNMYRRDQGGTGEEITADLVLVKMLNNKQFLEVLASQVAVVPVGT